MRPPIETALIDTQNEYALQDAVDVLENLRESDIVEAEAMGIPLEELKRNTYMSLFENAHEAYLIYQGEYVVGLYGCYSTDSLNHNVWLLCTPKLKAFNSFSKIAKYFLKKWRKEHKGNLHNMALMENTRNISWLRSLGFDIEEITNPLFPDKPLAYFSYNSNNNTKEGGTSINV